LFPAGISVFSRQSSGVVSRPKRALIGVAIPLQAMNPSPEPEGIAFHPGPFHPPSIEELNELIPAYDFVEFVDRGGMGAVYRARQRSLDRIVAVKLLPMAMSNRKAFSDRFKREARALALLNHPNIVSVYDFGEAAGGCLYYVMEYVKGTNLRQLMRAGETGSRKLLSIAMQVCEALQFAHINGVVHRDVKPANVLIDQRGHVKVADFGLAKVLGPTSGQQLTGASDALGTPEYMAPEAINHEHEVDHRADIYSLGVMLYEMLTGHVPRGAWEPPSRSVGTDARFDEIVSRAMQSDPRKRYQNIGELSTVMKQLVQASGTQTGISSPALSRVPPTLDPNATTVAMRPSMRRPRFSRLALTALGAALVGGVGFSYLKDHPFVQRLLHDAEKAPPAVVLTERERQEALARFVINHGGIVNLTTPYQREKLLTENINTFPDLPRSEYTVWRVTLDDPTFTDEDMPGLVRLCEDAGSVNNVNLHGSGVTAKGLVLLPRLNESMDSLNIANTAALSAKSLPYLVACKNLRLLKLSVGFVDGSSATTRTELELVHKLRDMLPECRIVVE
jgi:serine/threonine protein kinase